MAEKIQIEGKDTDPFSLIRSEDNKYIKRMDDFLKLYEDIDNPSNKKVKKRLQLVSDIFLSGNADEKILKQALFNSSKSYSDRVGLRYAFHREKKYNNATLKPDEFMAERLNAFKGYMDSLDEMREQKKLDLMATLKLPESIAEELSDKFTHRMEKNFMDELNHRYPISFIESAIGQVQKQNKADISKYKGKTRETALSSRLKKAPRADTSKIFEDGDTHMPDI